MAIEDIQEIRRTLQNLLPGTTYASRVRALNEFGQYSPWSEALEFKAEASGAASYELVAPTAPTIQPQINAITVIMNYNDPTDGISSYILEHSTDNENFSTIATTPIPLYVHQVPPGTTHYYRFYINDVYGTSSPVSPSNSGQSLSALTFKPYATVVIAAVDSGAPGAENADFVCDGIDDQITLAAAFDSVGETGKAILLEGTYNLSARVNSYISTIEGQGVWGTKIKLVEDISVGAILECENFKDIWIDGQFKYMDGEIVRAYQSITGCYFQNIKLESTVSGFYSRYISNCYFLSIENTGGSPGTTLTPNLYGRVIGNYFDNCTSGLELNYTNGVIVTGNFFEDCGTGVTVNVGQGTITGNSFKECTTSIINDGGDTSIAGNTFYPTGNSDIAILDRAGANIVANVFYECGVDVKAKSNVSNNSFFLQANERALYARAPYGSGMSFTSNLIHHSSSGGNPGVPPIRVDNSTTGVLITGNNITVYAATGAFSDAGINTSYGAGNHINGVWTVPVGAPGSDKHYTHSQVSNNATWTVVHNMNKFPSVVTVDNSGVQIFGTVTYNSANQVTIVFSSAQTGKAYCN